MGENSQLLLKQSGDIEPNNTGVNDWIVTATFKINRKCLASNSVKQVKHGVHLVNMIL